MQFMFGVGGSAVGLAPWERVLTGVGRLAPNTFVHRMAAPTYVLSMSEHELGLRYLQRACVTRGRLLPDSRQACTVRLAPRWFSRSTLHDALPTSHGACDSFARKRLSSFARQLDFINADAR